MHEASNQESRFAGLRRALLALIILLAFWGAIAYTLWPQLLPGLFGTVQAVRGIGAETIDSRYFNVRNNSDASKAQIGFVIKTLETQYEAIRELLGVSTDERISVLITNGSGPALAEGRQLNVFYDNGILNIDTAPFFLALLSNGGSVRLNENLAAQAGFALYVAEEIGQTQSLLGQPVDAWAELLRQKDRLLPLAQVWQIEAPQNEAQLFDFVRALIESGSFVRWVAKSYGPQAALDLRSGFSIEDVTGTTLPEAESQWLSALEAQQIQPKSCVLALPAGRFPPSICRQLDE